MPNVVPQRIPIELLGEQPRCFTSPQWMVWVASEVAEDGEVDPHGFCSACTLEYQHEMREAGRCRYPGTEFVLDCSTEEWGGVRLPLDQEPARTLADAATSERFREKIAPIIDAVKMDGPLSLRRQLFGPKNF